MIRTDPPLVSQSLAGLELPLRTVPEHAEVPRIAEAISRGLLTDASPVDALAERGWVLERRPFRHGSSVRSTLTPLDRGRFAIDINSNHPTDDRTIDWLICHELGHALFFAMSPNDRPRRGTYHGLSEERFCSRLADRLIGRTALSRFYTKAS